MYMLDRNSMVNNIILCLNIVGIADKSFTVMNIVLDYYWFLR